MMEDLTKTGKKKSRKLGIYEFFEILQIEWIVSDLRQRLYKKQKDKDFWKKVREGKKVTIEQIADKNKLPTIFTDSDLKSALEHRVFMTESVPNFHYKNEDNRLSQEYWDLLYYFFKDSDVRFELLGEVKVGKIRAYKPYDKFVSVCLPDGSELKLEVEKVTRIL